MSADPGFDPRAVVGRIVEQRYEVALDTVARLTEEFPDDDAEQLSARLVRQCARDLAMGGALSGGAAAAPAAGVTLTAAAFAGETTYGVSRLGEMVMAIGIVHGLDHSSASERATWVGAVLGISEGAAMGLTGVAAKAGAVGSSRVLARLARASATGSGRTRKLATAASRKGGPWSLAALLPYGIGAGVGAAGNAALAFSVGRAARGYFAGRLPGAQARPAPGAATSAADEEIWEAEFIEERFLDLDVDPPA